MQNFISIVLNVLIDVVGKQCTMIAPSITTHSNLKVGQPIHLEQLHFNSSDYGTCQNQKEMVERTVFYVQKTPSNHFQNCMALYNWLKSATLFSRNLIFFPCFVLSIKK